MNELQVVESEYTIPAKLDVARRALAEATEDWQRIDIRDYARAVAAASAILERRDIQAQAANLVQDAERAIAKANPPKTRYEASKTTNQEKNSKEVSNSDRESAPTLTNHIIKDMRRAHYKFTDEEYEEVKAEAIANSQPLTRSALIKKGYAKVQAETLQRREEAVKARNAKSTYQETTPTTFQTLPKVYFGDNLSILSEMPDGSVNLVYTDPPFNTGESQTDRDISYSDAFGDTEAYLDFLRPRFEEVHRVLHPMGSLFFHIDQRESHYCKIMLDEIFGRESFINEIIWAYDFGGRSNKRWAAKHDTIFWYAKNPESYTFNSEERDRIPYMAPGLVGEEKASKGKFPTDVWWHTIVPTASPERTGYPTQKPLGVVERIVKVHSKPGDTLLDLFAGSGTLGEAAAQLERHSILIDNNPDAIRIMLRRLKDFGVTHANASPGDEDFKEITDG